MTKRRKITNPDELERIRAKRRLQLLARATERDNAGDWISGTIARNEASSMERLALRDAGAHVDVIGVSSSC